jgi:hypothetical protein
MTPEFEDLVKKINNTLHNTGNSHATFKKLVTYYGEALRNFIEDDPLSKPTLKALKIKGADLTKATKGIGDLLKLSHDLSFGGKVTADAVTTEASACGKHAAADADTAKNVPAAGDQASEYYVDAAMWYFRQALCTYCGNDLTNAKLPSAGGPAGPNVFNAREEYAIALNSAAQMLTEAARNEDATDYAEIIAENVAANIFFNEAKTLLDGLKNEVEVKKTITFLNPAAKQRFEDIQTAADKGATSTETNLTNYKQ